MAIRVTCGSCGRVFRARDTSQGETASCPGCSRTVEIVGETVPGYDTFISYSSKDKHIADAVCATLEGSQVRCWIAPRDVLAGKEWGASIVDAIADSRVMVLILSGHSNISGQVLREVERAVSRGLPILTLKIDDCRLSKNMEYFISASHWLDAAGASMDARMSELATKVKALLGSDIPVIPDLPGNFQETRRGGVRFWEKVGLIAIILGGLIAGASYLERRRSDASANNQLSNVLSQQKLTAPSKPDPFQFYESGNSAGYVIAADLLHNGIQDIVTADAGARSASVFLGKGDGTFFPKHTLVAGDYPISVAAADLKGNGVLDVIVSNQGGNSLSLFRGVGNGNFEKQQLINGFAGPYTIAVGDFHGSGKADVLVADRRGVSMLSNNGDGTLSDPVLLYSHADCCRISPGHFTTSGHLDFVTGIDRPDSDNGLIFLGDGHGRFKPPVVVRVPGDPCCTAVGRFTARRDAVEDVIFGTRSNTIVVSLTKSDGTFWPSTSLAMPYGSGPVAACDLRGTGTDDIISVWGDPNDSVSVLLGNGDGTFRPPLRLVCGDGPNCITTAVLSKTGKPDIITADMLKGGVRVIPNQVILDGIKNR